MGYALVVCAIVICFGDLLHCIILVIDDVSISRREQINSTS